MPIKADKDFKHYAGLLDQVAAESSADGIAADLALKGWSLVRISKIADEPIVIAYEKNLPGIPAGYAVYTAPALEHVGAILESGGSVYLVHAAIKMGAKLITEDE